MQNFDEPLTHRLMDRAQNALDQAIRELAMAEEAGVSEEVIESAQRLQRRAQFRVDFINAENSHGFQAPQEAARILGEAIDFSRSIQIQLRDADGQSVFGPFEPPP